MASLTTKNVEKIIRGMTHPHRKVMFIADYLSGRLNFSQLCAAHSISRITGYKWVAAPHSGQVSISKVMRRRGRL